ncbi:hypothetical protein A2Z33_04555 [Candidatus Gottesmanbacteria bacterium RBG_16_52_11]|uniref:LamG-like jellyroll fold domain-containing protein n=1 Tax=Candidatus Gottesmanbacteria bacterium RBG_16_52_11 TaxID=1798374 RepID=A0A1F5YN53_9BACT|nr:MAG: hypothetical protein A2Z33_04555 [Candidatus Gottesmanbacteria bacterium RBG_16_52_11]
MQATRNSLSTAARDLHFTYSPDSVSTFDVRYNEIFVRKYVSSEPTLEVGAETPSYLPIKPITISGWINATTLDANDRVIIARNASPSYSWYVANDAANPGKLEFSTDGGVTTGVSTLTLSTGTWYHIVLAADETKTRLYINGTPDKEITHTGILYQNGNIALGADTSGSNAWNGKIDDVRIYDRALSPAEISQLYNWAPGPVAWWKLDEGSGSNAHDSSGNGYSGTLTNGPGWTNGQYGKGIKTTVNGTMDYVSVADPASGALDFDNTQNYTIDFWLKLSDVDGSGTAAKVINKNYTDAFNAAGYSVRFAEGGGAWGFDCVYSDSNSGNGLDIATVGTTTVTDGNWHHVSCVMDRDGSATGTSGLYAYFDGQQYASDTSLTEGSAVNSGVLTIGDEIVDNSEMTGSLDDVRIYNYAHTTGKVVEDMNAGHPAPGSPVGSAALSYNFDEGYGNSGTIVHDSSPNNYDGAVISGTPPVWSNDCKFNKCISVDDTHWGLDAGDISLFDSLSRMTVVMWVKPTTLTVKRVLASKSDMDLDKTTGSYNSWTISEDNTNSDEIRVYIHSNITDVSNYFTTTNLNLANGTWDQIVMVYDGSQAASDRVKVFKNGTLTTGTITGTIPTSMVSDSSGSNVTVGGSWGPDLDPFIGSFDDFKIFTSALTADQVKQLFNQSSAAVMGALSTDSSGNASWSGSDAYCPPGQGSACIAPVGEWTFDEKSGTTIYDRMGTGGDPVFSGDPKWVKGKHGSAVFFDGTDDKAEESNTAPQSLVITGSVTLSAWVNRTAGGTDDDIVRITGSGAGEPGNIAYKLFYNGSDDRLRWQHQYGAGLNIAFSSPNNPTVVSGVWVYVAAVRDATAKTVTFYENGIRLGNPVSYSDNATGGTNNPDFGFGTASGDEFNGSIDDVRIYNYARTQAQIAWEFNQGAPVAYWQFDDCQGTTAYNAAPTASGAAPGNNASIFIGATAGNTSAGSCSSGQGSESWNDGTTGKRNYSLDFDGADDVATVSAFSPLASAGQTTTNLSWGSWLYPKTSAATKTVMEKVTEFRLTTDGSGKPICDIYTGGAFTTNTAGASAQALSLNTWQHVLCTYDGTTIKVYVNGNQTDSWIQGGSITAASSALHIAQNSSSAQRFEGQLDEMMVFTYPLTAIQVKTLINEGAVRYGPLQGAPQ